MLACQSKPKFHPRNKKAALTLGKCGLLEAFQLLLPNNNVL
jgi:hypothetical protein